MKGIMVQGTGSGVGKSIITVALCRYFSMKGYRVTPFKAQNMALNSFITKEGAEIGRAQALQAMAAGVEPTWAMNPVLLKASGPLGTQVILKGKPIGTLKPSQYYALRDKAWEAVLEGWDYLSQEFDIAVVEGAGSPAEINLKDVEIVNMAVAKRFELPVVLVGDIDKGGVFASLYGTLALLEEDAKYIKAFIINKFRGDIQILEPGLKAIEEKTKVPVIGVIPYMKELFIEEEDSLGLQQKAYSYHLEPLKIVILKLPFISNFTDFVPLLYEEDTEVVFSLRAVDLLNADLIIIPGTKNTIEDLEYLKKTAVVDTLKKALNKGVYIFGICGGYQMMGKVLRDPDSIESSTAETRGLGFLETETEFLKEKTTTQVIAEQLSPIFDSVKVDGSLWGYEIHMGTTQVDGSGLFSGKRLSNNEQIIDGSAKGYAAGTYLHGIFENDHFRLALLNHLRQRRGLPLKSTTFSYRELRDRSIKQITDIVVDALDMDFIERLLQ